MDELEPFWQVMLITDPDVSGTEFGYTVGLAQRGLPELHMWFRPTEGDDPGADFSLSGNDVGYLLNRTASELTAGALGPGSEFVQEFDSGHAFGRFRLGDPTDPGPLEAHQVETGAQVVPISWSLTRVPVGTPKEVSSVVSESIRMAAARWQSMLGELGCEFDPPGESTAADQEFGPWTPVVLRMRAALKVAGAGWASLMVDAYTEDIEELRRTAPVAQSVARAQGRLDAHQAALRAATTDADLLATEDDDMFVDFEGDEAELLAMLKMAVREVLALAYGVTVVADLLEKRVVEMAQGPLIEFCTAAAAD